jgi:hypothetical protein
MKTGTVLLVSCAALALLAVVALRARWDATDAQSATAALAAQNGQARDLVDQLEKRLRDARTSAAPAKPQTAEPRGDSSRPADATTKSTPGNVPPKTENAPRLSAKTIIANEPAKRAVYLANFRAQLDIDHGGMFKALRLSPEQIEKFKDAQVWAEQEQMDIRATIETEQLDPRGARARMLWANFPGDRAAREAEALGDLTERYLEYNKTARVRPLARRLAAPELVPGETVTADQVERATNILSTNSKFQWGRDAVWNPSSVNWNVAREQLKGVLSPAQIEWLGLFVEERAASARVSDFAVRLTAEFRSKSAGKTK